MYLSLLAERELSGEMERFTKYVKGQFIAETRFAAGAVVGTGVAVLANISVGTSVTVSAEVSAISSASSFSGEQAVTAVTRNRNTSRIPAPRVAIPQTYLCSHPGPTICA